MTEPRGRAARWSAAALAAPVAAGLFAGTTAWASGHDPLHPDGAPSKPAPAPVATGDPSLVALRQEVAANSEAVARLARQLAAVKAQTAALTGGKGHGGATAGRSGSGGSGGSSGSGSARSGPASSAGHSTTTHSTTTAPTTPKKTKAPTPAPPPPPQSTTGASGSGG